MTDAAVGLVLYVREGCHLCEQFLLELSLEIGPAIELLAVVDVDGDPELAVRYGLRVPVLAAGTGAALRGRARRSPAARGIAAIIARFRAATGPAGLPKP